MEFNKTVSNPMLVGCIQLMKAEDTPEHREMFVQELEKSTLMSPAIMIPEPVKKEDGELAVLPGSKVQFPMLQAPDGKKFFMGFTDPIEHQKWVEKNRELPVFTLTFEDYVSMLFRNDGQGSEGVAMGVVINSYGANVVVPKEMFAGIMARRMGTFRTMPVKDAEPKQ